jgi:hypothetical protein
VSMSLNACLIEVNWEQREWELSPSSSWKALQQEALAARNRNGFRGQAGQEEVARSRVDVLTLYTLTKIRLTLRQLLLFCSHALYKDRGRSSSNTDAMTLSRCGVRGGNIVVMNDAVALIRSRLVRSRSGSRQRDGSTSSRGKEW